MKDLNKVLEGLVGGIIKKINIEHTVAGDNYIKIETDNARVELIINDLGAEVVDYEK